MRTSYTYRYRAVAFLDVLGFKNKLNEFENEAINNRISEDEDEDEEGEVIINGKFSSLKANEFINTFLNAIEKLDDQKFSYYLFSDNICITSINQTSPTDLEDLLLIISELYFDFAQKGYFLRGGIDYGLFIDDNKIAVGTPLSTAYNLESNKANFPRIILSDNLVNQFLKFNELGDKVFNYPFAELLVQKSCEISFLNVFLHVFRSDYKEQIEDFFSNFKKAINQNMNDNILNEKIYFKYKWIADEFNSFIDQFTSKLIFSNENINPEDDPNLIEYIKNQKIFYED